MRKNQYIGWQRILPAIVLIIIQCFTNSALATKKPPFDMAVQHSEALQPVPLIARETFFKPAVIGQAYLSPDARYVVHTETFPKFVTLMLTDTATRTTRKLFSTKQAKGFQWTKDSTHILFSTPEGVAISDVFNAPAPALIVRFNDQEFDWLGNIDINSNEHFFVNLYNQQSKNHVFNRVSITGEQQAIFHSTEPIINALQIRGSDKFFISILHESLPAIFKLDNGKIKFIQACEYDEDCHPIAYDQHTHQLTIKANLGNNLSRLATIDLDTGTVSTRHIDPEKISDLTGFQTDPKNGELLIASYIRAFKENYGLTATAQKHTQNIETHFGPYTNLTIDARLGDIPWLVSSQLANRRALQHHIYDPTNATITDLLQEPTKHSTLTESILAPVVPFSYQASDGMMLYAYLTLPRGIDISTAPLIVVPHGGPWSRVYGTYNIVTQFLANRGYIVYSPNFRASEGYGRHYLESANCDFGDGRVQDDVLDGLYYLLDNNIGDKHRLGIYGHSFGGFTTLGALAFTPELFQIGVAGAPPADLSGTFLRLSRKGKFFRSNPLAPIAFKHRIGALEDQAAMDELYQKSPLAHVEKVNKPLLIMAGKRDDRVSSDEVLEYAIKLDKQNKPISMLLAENQGHSYHSDHARIAYFYLLETMLARYLDGQHEALNESSKDYEKIQRFIQKNTLIDHLEVVQN